MDILSLTDAETYLMNKQVYIRKEIVNRKYKTIAEAYKVHNIKAVEIDRLNISTIAFRMIINDEEITLYEYKTDIELISWIKSNFIPVNELVYKWLN